jgi:uncharacterized protein YkwD
MPHRSAMVLSLVTAGAVAVTFAPPSRADNSRFNRSVVSNVYTVQRQAGCTNRLTISPQLQLAAQWHTDDVLNNRNLNGDIGSDGSTPQDRARAAGFTGKVAETVAINPALAISGIELINMWYYDPDDLAIMRDCANTQIGVWSENSLDRTVVVAVYGQPSSDTGVRVSSISGAQEAPPDPSPDYDASDEIEYGIDWFPWILRGVYPPPAYPAQ